MRRFGTEACDLDVDFTSRPPYVVTELLRRCAKLDDDAAWDLPVGARIETLVTIASLAGVLFIALRCPDSRCGEALEIEITPAELRGWCAQLERDAASVVLNGRELRIRRPTGRDQRAWLNARWQGAEATRRSMLATLVSPQTDGLDAAALSALEAELERIDPLVGFYLTVACPACGASAPHVIDLQGYALATLRRAQERLLESVVRLARRFHWTEAEIFALPAWRRERYLALSEAAQ